MELNIKWGKEKFNVQADTGESPMLFKAELFSLTGVPPERQKTMFKVNHVYAFLLFVYL